MKKESLNKNLHSAKNAKKDEFYTQLADIEKELKHYKEHFKDKTVFCNCDDPRVSNFFHYFSFNFENLELKKLITTCYKNQDADLFSNHESEKAIYLEYFGDKNGDKVPGIEEIGIKYLEGDGDFRSKESIELLKQADIVVTNPPFSLFREYVAQLIEYDKKFVIIGNINAVSYKEIFPFIKENKIWLGFKSTSQSMFFKINDNEYAKRVSSERPEGSWWRNIDSQVHIGINNSCWFTNLDIDKRHEDLILYKKYSPEKYPNYDNYDAINVNVTKDIPCDYEGAMGVPITFLDKYNPEQFEIVGIDRVLVEEITGKVSRFRIDGKELYARIVIRNKRLG